MVLISYFLYCYLLALKQVHIGGFLKKNYKFISAVTISIDIAILWVIKIGRYVINEIALINASRDIYDLQQIYENTFEVRANEPLLISEKDVNYDLLKREAIINYIIL